MLSEDQKLFILKKFSFSESPKTVQSEISCTVFGLPETENFLKMNNLTGPTFIALASSTDPCIIIRLYTLQKNANRCSSFSKDWHLIFSKAEVSSKIDSRSKLSHTAIKSSPFITPLLLKFSKNRYEMTSFSKKRNGLKKFGRIMEQFEEIRLLCCVWPNLTQCQKL